jgi:hypothetical protein
MRRAHSSAERPLTREKQQPAFAAEKKREREGALETNVMRTSGDGLVRGVLRLYVFVVWVCGREGAQARARAFVRRERVRQRKEGRAAARPHPAPVSPPPPPRLHLPGPSTRPPPPPLHHIPSTLTCAALVPARRNSTLPPFPFRGARHTTQRARGSTTTTEAAARAPIHPPAASSRLPDRIPIDTPRRLSSIAAAQVARGSGTESGWASQKCAPPPSLA